MTRKTHALRAGSAIAAALALGSTPLLAQDAAAPPVAVPPVAAPPVTSSAPAPAPQPIPAPAPAPAPVMTSNPVVQEVPPKIVVPDVGEEAEPEAAAPVREASRAPRQAPAAQPAERSAPEPVASAEPSLPEEASAPPVATVPVVSDVAPLPATDTAEPASDTSLGMLPAILGAIAVVALAIWGFVAIGRRRPRTAVPVVERPVVAEREPEPVVAPPLAEATVTPLASPRPHTADSDSLAHSGASIALPSKMPESFEERDALLKRMIAAKPDRANPFRSPLQRRRRAKLILQSLGRDFGDTEPWIDLSQYPSNWPSVARRTSAAA